MGTRFYRVFLAYRVLIGFACQVPFYTLYCLSQGLHYSDLMFLAVCFSCAKIAMDVPAGILADRVGRRVALYLRIALESISILFLLRDEFIASTLLAGSALAFSGSAETALVYEWSPTQFLRIFGRAASWGHVSTAVAAVVGAGLATLDYSLVFVARLFALAGAGALIWMFPEHREENPLRVDKAVQTLSLRPIVFIGLLGAVHIAALQLQQPFLVGTGVPVAALGALFVAFQIATAIGARIATRLPGAFMIVTILSIAGFGVMAFPIGAAGILALFVHKFAFGISLPTVGRILNQNAAPQARATSISMRSLSEGAALAVCAPIMGWAADAWSIQAAFAVAAALSLPVSYFRRHHAVNSLDRARRLADPRRLHRSSLPRQARFGPSRHANGYPPSRRRVPEQDPIRP